jgi:hypothetical protein
MIRKGSLPHDLDPATTKRPEKPSGIADAGESKYPLAAQRCQRRLMRSDLRR